MPSKPQLVRVAQAEWLSRYDPHRGLKTIALASAAELGVIDAVDVCHLSPARGRAPSSSWTGVLLRGVSLALV